MPFIQLFAATYFLLWSTFTPLEAHAMYAGPPVVLTYISQCESGQRQFDSSGRVLTSKTHDVGLFQINISHRKEAESMGYDIMTPEGNTAYAIYLYNTQGVSPWGSSSSCWKKKMKGVDGT